ncbi:MAG TPA: AraC family transcriptional regulator [Methylibium sp.]|nr:AraC family transcriptional regulator [Methylibium sp.]
MVMEKDTVSIHFASAAVARLTAAARRHVLAAAGIPPELLASAQARVPAQAFAALWLAVAREIDDEFFGLDRRRMKVGSFALLCQAVLPSGTLDRAIKQMLRGFAVFLDDIGAELALEDGQAVITLADRIADAEARRFADETFLVMVHGLMCWLAGRRIPLQAAEFAHARPDYAAEYAVMYTQHLRFDAPATAIRFDGRLLAAPVVQDARSLKSFLLTAPQSVFLKYKNEDSWTARLRRRLRDGVGQDGWPTLEDVARESHVGPTTLRRRLDAEGSSFQGIKDELRRDMAIHQLCSTNLSIADIGVLLGFQEPSAFYRAFKRWSGVQPGEYRARVARRP